MLSSSAWTDNCGEGMVAGFTLSLRGGGGRSLGLACRHKRSLSWHTGDYYRCYCYSSRSQQADTGVIFGRRMDMGAV